MSFSTFPLGEPLLKALSDKGYTSPTPIQASAIMEILSGRDVLGTAQTGTGKTGAFCIPILQKLSSSKNSGGVRALILTPTRELATQVSDNLSLYGKYLNIKNAVVFGGVPKGGQIRQLRNGAEIIVATPGRLLDLMNEKVIHLRNLEILVLDEADRMLDMGFINDIKRILKFMPAQRQNIFFSATMPDEVQDLVSSILRNPVRIAIEDKREKAKINQGVYYVSRDSKRELLTHLIEEQQMENVLVFTRTKYGADKLARVLKRSGISAEAFHGNKSQRERERTLSNFKGNTTRVLVATDIAARGIDIVNLPFVINYELPDSAETYTHRIGRTGRAGASGTAFTLCSQEEMPQLKSVRRLFADLKTMQHPFGNNQEIQQRPSTTNSGRSGNRFNRRSNNYKTKVLH